MAELALAELEALDRALDLFGGPCRVPEVLLAEGLHPPLPVCGRYLAWGFPLLAAIPSDRGTDVPGPSRGPRISAIVDVGRG